VPQRYTIDAAEDWIRRQQRLDDHAAIGLAIRVAGAEGPVGMVGLFGLDQPGVSARFGHWVLRALRGGGLASLATQLLADWAFSTLNVDALHIDVEPGNEASRRLAESLGAKQSDTVRRELDGSELMLQRYTLRRSR
jgi:ribosomal-protein-alanine N-acetyltransferase